MGVWLAGDRASPGSYTFWASHYLCALAKALLDDAELGMMKTP
nr:hypothetical protein [Pseudomonas putida]